MKTLDLRTRSGQFFIEVRNEIAADLGGLTHLSRQQRELTDRAAGISTRLSAEDALYLSGKPSMSAGEYATLSNSLTRTLMALGLKRVARDVTPNFRDYIAAKAAEKAQVAV